MHTPDALDRSLLRLLLTEPRLGVLETSRRLGIARGTVQARLTRLERGGVLRDWAPTLDPGPLGFPVLAFATLEVHQGRGHREITEHLRSIPEVLEAHTTSGQGDLLCRVVARDHPDLQRVLDAITATGLVARTSTVISLVNEVPYRVAQLLDCQKAPGGGSVDAGQAGVALEGAVEAQHSVHPVTLHDRDVQGVPG